MTFQNNLPAIHPGIFLAEILDETNMSQAELARKIGVSRMNISHIVNGKRPITVETACLIGKVFGQTPQYWLNLQTDYDLKTLDVNLLNKINKISPVEMVEICDCH